MRLLLASSGHFAPALGRECVCPSASTTGAIPRMSWGVRMCIWRGVLNPKTVFEGVTPTSAILALIGLMFVGVEEGRFGRSGT